MSRTLSLSYFAWSQALRPSPFARQRLEQVVAMAALPVEELANAHRMLAEHWQRAGRHAQARRAWRSAIKLKPDCINSILGYGQSWEDDPYGSDRRAANAYRTATRLEPRNAMAWASLGRACVRIQRDRVASKALRRAIRLAPGDAHVLAIVVEALREAGRLKAAATIVARARFLNPKSMAIQTLSDRVRFECARHRQGRRPNNGPATVLPFVRVVGADGRRHTVRRDGPAGPVSLRFQRGG